MTNEVKLEGYVTRDVKKLNVKEGTGCTINMGFQFDGSKSYINVVCWDDVAEYALKNLSKGCEILVEGSLEIRIFTGRENKAVKQFRIKANKITIKKKQKTERARPAKGLGDLSEESRKKIHDILGT